MTPVEFLRAIQPEGPWALGAIEPDGDARAWRTVGSDEQAVAEFVRRKQRHNLYYQINRVREDLGSRRATKKDVAECVAVHAEIDPPPDENLAHWQRATRRELKAWRRADVPRPSVTVFSGSGFQLVWLLDEPTGDRDAVESRNRAVARLLDADSATDVSRLLRLPARSTTRTRGSASATAEPSP